MSMTGCSQISTAVRLVKLRPDDYVPERRAHRRDSNNRGRQAQQRHGRSAHQVIFTDWSSLGTSARTFHQSLSTRAIVVGVSEIFCVDFVVVKLCVYMSPYCHTSGQAGLHHNVFRCHSRDIIFEFLELHNFTITLTSTC